MHSSLLSPSFSHILSTHFSQILLFHAFFQLLFLTILQPLFLPLLTFFPPFFFTNCFYFFLPRWLVSNKRFKISRSCTTFAPGNLKATADNSDYKALVNYWIDSKYTLRYSGGLVPDIYHILTKVTTTYLVSVTSSCMVVWCHGHWGCELLYVLPLNHSKVWCTVWHYCTTYCTALQYIVVNYVTYHGLNCCPLYSTTLHRTSSHCTSFQSQSLHDTSPHHTPLHPRHSAHAGPRGDI